MKYLFTLVFCLTSLLALSQGAGIRIVDSIPTDTPVINNYQALKVFNSADHHFYSWEDSTWIREGSLQDSITVKTIEDSLDYDRIILEPGQRLALADTSGYESFLLYPDGKIVFGNNVATPTYFFEVYSQSYYDDLLNLNDNWLISGGSNFQVKPWSSNAVGNFVVQNTSNQTLFGVDIDGDISLNANTNADGGVSFRNYVTYFPQSRTISAGTGLNFINDALIKVTGSGGAVDITADPQIVAGQNGQILVIVGDSDTNTVTFDDGTGLALDGGVSAVLGNNDVLQVAYDSGDAVWYEISRTNN